MEKFKNLTKNKISELPESPGVYAFKSGKQFLYIGKAVNLRDRVKQHKLDSVEFSKLNRVKFIAYIKTVSETEALLLEAKLIKKYQPKYNVEWKDDKNYFYVGITKEKFPRVFITHQPQNNGGSTSIIGPFVDGKNLKQILKDLRKIHPYRTCKTLPKKPCLWYHLKQCPAPCLPRRQAGAFWGQRIEAYDISNIQGQEATGSMVTFVNGRPDKNFYRKFKIKTVAGPNDVAMLREVLSRRAKHREWPYPDIILIDGGIGQLNAAPPSFRGIKIMALAKKENKLYIKGKKNPLLLKSLPEKFSHLILRARDEAHRFARAYHHKLRDRALLD